MRLRLSMTPPAWLFSSRDATAQGDAATAKIIIGCFVFSPKSKRLWSAFDLNSRQHADLLKDGFQLRKALEVPGEFTEGVFKIVVYDPANDRLGSAAAEFMRN